MDGCTSTSSVQIKVSECTALTEYESTTSMEVFPNPCDGAINVKSPVDQKMSFYNYLGEVVKEVDLSAEFVNRIDLSALPAGTYFFLNPNGGKKYQVVILR